MDQTKIGTESDGNLTAQLEESSRLQEILAEASTMNGRKPMFANCGDMLG